MRTKFTIILLASVLVNVHLFAQWVKTNGPAGITINAYLNKDNLLFAGTEAKGIYKSADHGLTWLACNSAATANIEVLSLASDDNYLYAGTLEEGMFRSPDNGASWQPAGLQAHAINSIIVANGYVFAGSIGDGIFRSPDQATTWEDINQNLLTDSYILAMVYQNHRLIIEADNYLFFSTDDGDSWGIDQGTTEFYVINHFFHHGDTLLASAGSTVFRSTNGGVSWGNAIHLNYALVGFGNSNDTIYAGYKYGVMRSTNWGQAWTAIPSSDMRYGSRFQNDFVISGNNFITAFEEIGAYLSQDKGSSWVQSSLFNFSRASTIDDAMINVKETIYTGTHSDGVYKSSDQGANWNRIGTPIDTDTLSNEIIFAMLHDGDNILLAGSCGDGLFRSANNGATWTHIYNGLPKDITTGFTCIKSLARSGPNIIAALTVGVYYSADSGITWHPSTIFGGITVNEASGLAVHGNIVCVGIIASPGRGIYRSTDNGVTFSLAEGLLDIEMLKEGGGTHMYAGTLFDGYRSDDDGLTWSGLGSGIPGGAGVFTIMAWDNYVFIGNSSGVFFSEDFGASFIDASQGLDPYPNNAVQGLTRDDQYLYAGLYKDAVWRRPISDFITVVPLTMGPLKAIYKEQAGKLTWSTYTESNTSRFEIERSINGVDFTKTGQVTATGTSSTKRDYSFDDKQPFPGSNYYRLKINDIDGKFIYSNIASIKVPGSSVVKVLPNPFTTRISIEVNSLQNQSMETRLMDETGRLILQQQDILHTGTTTISLDKLDNLNQGVYILELVINGIKSFYKMVK